MSFDELFSAPPVVNFGASIPLDICESSRYCTLLFGHVGPCLCEGKPVPPEPLGVFFSNGESAEPAPRKLNRMSSLPVVQYCPQAARLGAQYGAGRAAAMSSYFHARCAGVPCGIALSAEELEAVDTWHTPTDVTLWNGTILTYAEAEKELALSYPGSPGEDGHLDFAWATIEETTTVYVADIKKSKWTTLDGPESLQLMAYAVSYALRLEADFFCTGIFVAEDGEWQWLNRLIAVDSDEFRAIQARVMAAAQNTEGQASTGSHCRDCYARLHCPEHVLAATASIGFLAPIAEGHKVATNEELRGLLLAAQSVAELAEKAIAHVKEAARRGATIADPETGKVYKAIQCKGREGVTPKSLREKMGEAAEQYIEQGKPYSMFRWVKT